MLEQHMSAFLGLGFKSWLELSDRETLGFLETGSLDISPPALKKE